MEADKLTDYFNRAVPDSEQAERLRLAAIRSRAAAVLSREVGGIKVLADRPDLTALVQEVWLKMERAGPWNNRAHFLASATMAARQFLIDEARKRKRRVRTCSMELAHEPAAGLNNSDSDLILQLEILLSDLADESPPDSIRTSRVAGFKLFGGLSSTVIAEIEGVSIRTVDRDWAYARAWLGMQFDRD